MLSAIIAMITSMLAGMLGALIYSFLTISLRANQNVTGLTLTIFGTGFGNFFGEYIGQKAGGYVAVFSVTKAAFSGLRIPVLSELPVVGPLLFNYNWLVYLAILLAVFLSWFLTRSRVGLNLRAVGEDPATADAVGINVTLYKYAATVIGGGICGIGGMYMSMVTTSGVWGAWLCQRLRLAGGGTGYLLHLAAVPRYGGGADLRRTHHHAYVCEHPWPAGADLRYAALCGDYPGAGCNQYAFQPGACPAQELRPQLLP